MSCYTLKNLILLGNGNAAWYGLQTDLSTTNLKEFAT